MEINRFNMHALELPWCPMLLTTFCTGSGERERVLAEWTAAVRVHSAQEPILDENPHRASVAAFFALPHALHFLLTS